MMKKIISLLIAMLLLPVSVFAKEPVKVYIFEAGGCPACEAQMEYLKGLDSYNEKFVIVEKEAYIDHVDWAQGKDYKLAKTVADAFLAKGFSDATYQATPFVVVSDVYAKAGYNASLENVINEVYESGEDADIVACYEEGRTDCLDHIATDGTNTKKTKKESTNSDIILIVICCTLALGGVYWYKSTKDTKKIIESLKK